MLSKNPCNGFAGQELYGVVKVNKLIAKRIGKQRAYGRFAGAAEAS